MCGVYEKYRRICKIKSGKVMKIKVRRCLILIQLIYILKLYWLILMRYVAVPSTYVKMFYRFFERNFVFLNFYGVLNEIWTDYRRMGKIILKSDKGSTFFYHRRYLVKGISTKGTSKWASFLNKRDLLNSANFQKKIRPLVSVSKTNQSFCDYFVNISKRFWSKKTSSEHFLKQIGL